MEVKFDSHLKSSGSEENFMILNLKNISNGKYRYHRKDAKGQKFDCYFIILTILRFLDKDFFLILVKF